MDETGHAADNDQLFCGMAGFLTTADKMPILESRWKEVLRRFNVGYMHMKEYGPSTGIFKDWKNDEGRRRAFLSELLRILRDLRAIPFGSIYSLAAIRGLSNLDRELLNNPYLKSMTDCVGIPAFLLQDKPKEVRYRVILSAQTEYQHRATRVYELFRAIYTIGERMTFPLFRDMREFVPLQAADVVAYELSREFGRRLYKPSGEKPRYGYGQISRMAERTLPFPSFFFFSDEHIRTFISDLKTELSANGIPLERFSESWKAFYSRKDLPRVDGSNKKRV